MIWINLLVNYIVGGYALYKVVNEIKTCYKINGFGIYFLKFNFFALMKWMAIIAIVQKLVQFIFSIIL